MASPGRVTELLRAWSHGDREALDELVVELRYFGGLSVAEAAEVPGVSTATVKRDWSVARLWLRRELERSAGAQPRRTGRP